MPRALWSIELQPELEAVCRHYRVDVELFAEPGSGHIARAVAARDAWAGQ